MSEAEDLKNKGNEEFKNKKYKEAIHFYSEAIKLNPGEPALWSNRAFAEFRMDEFGSAISDATRAIEVDPKFTKAYYRRGSALIALGKFEDALKDFRDCVRLAPADRDARLRLKECEKVVTERKFLAAIATGEEDVFKDLVTDVDVEPSYNGPRLPESGIPDLSFCESLKAYQLSEKLLHKSYVNRLLLSMRDYLEKQPTLVDIEVTEDTHVTVCGDVHGQYYDLCNIFTINGNPSQKNPYLFIGDFVDRGSFSVEVILLLFSYKLALPDHFFLSRGNHETKNMNKMYGFEGELKAKYSVKLYEPFAEVFCLLPLAHLINRRVFCVHGGLFQSDGVTIDDIRKVKRKREPSESGLMTDMLWSDPQEFNGRSPSKRGIGCSFGPDVTREFCENNGIDMVIRAHEVKDNGYEVVHEGRLATVFSAPNYCDQIGNKGAFVRFSLDNNLSPVFTSFSHVPHPNKPPMAYANSLFSFA